MQDWDAREPSESEPAPQSRSPGKGPRVALGTNKRTSSQTQIARQQETVLRRKLGVKMTINQRS
jgi:hypothetical protein